MTTAFFNPNGGPLTAKAFFFGDLVADYGLFLKAGGGNAQTLLLEGDNINSEDDNVVLPTPAAINDGRRVKLETLFFGNHPDINKDYEIRLEIFQDGIRIGADVDKSNADNILTGKAQPSLLLITLVAR